MTPLEVSTFVVRVWLPDRPGALGAVASRIGAVRGSVVGIEILERGAGRAIDELVVELPDASLLDLLIDEIGQVDGVDVEDVRPVTDGIHDPRLDALETAAILVGASSGPALYSALCDHAARTIGTGWAAVVDLPTGDVRSCVGETPPPAWLAAFVAGSRTSASVAAMQSGPDDIAWAPLPAAGLAVVIGRDGIGFRARERRQLGALARIADTRARELARADHPSSRAQSRLRPTASRQRA